MSLLSEAQIGRFQRQGHLVYGPLVTDGELEEIRRAFETQTEIYAADIGSAHEEYLEVISQWTNIWEDNERFRRQLRHVRAATIATELIGCERVRVFHDHVIVKPPRAGATIPWHRDLPNLPIAEPRAVSCWLALDDVTVESGAMRFMIGGHRAPMSPSIDFLNEAKDWGDRESEAVAVEVPAGSAVFHHCLSWHSSPPNVSDAWRRAYIVIYMDAKCTFAPERAPWHPMRRRVTVQRGEPFNDDVFPILGQGVAP